MTNASSNGLSESFSIQAFFFFLYIYVHFGDHINGDHVNDGTTALIILV